MAVLTYDTQHGATITLSSDSLTLRVTSIGPGRRTGVAVETSYHGTATNATFIAGDLLKGEPITITYQNSPAIANPTPYTVQTLTITGPTPSGGSSGEILAVTGFVTELDDTPGYDSSTGSASNLQMKTFTFHPDGTTRTRTAAA